VHQISLTLFNSKDLLQQRDYVVTKKKWDYVCCVLLGTLLLVTLVKSYFEPERYIQYLELNGYK